MTKATMFTRVNAPVNTTNALCDSCGITAADLPYEEIGLDLDEVSDLLFSHAGGSHDMVLCKDCAA